MKLSDYKGKVVLLNFWATWCPPCRAEMPEPVRLQKEDGSRGLQILGVTYPSYKRDAVRRLARKLKLNYPVVFGSRELADIYEVGEVLPTTVVVDREGKIRDRILGILETKEFEEKIKPHFSQLVSPISFVIFSISSRPNFSKSNEKDSSIRHCSCNAACLKCLKISSSVPVANAGS